MGEDKDLESAQEQKKVGRAFSTQAPAQNLRDKAAEITHGS